MNPSSPCLVFLTALKFFPSEHQNCHSSPDNDLTLKVLSQLYNMLCIILLFLLMEGDTVSRWDVEQLQSFVGNVRLCLFIHVWNLLDACSRQNPGLCHSQGWIMSYRSFYNRCQLMWFHVFPLMLFIPFSFPIEIQWCLHGKYTDWAMSWMVSRAFIINNKEIMVKAD